MATLPGSRRARGGSNDELGAIPKPPGRSPRPASTRRAAAVAEVAAADVLTAEEEYLLKIFRRYRKHAPASPAAAKAPAGSDGKASPPRPSSSNRRSPSPVPDRSKVPLSAKGGLGLGAVGTAAVDKKFNKKGAPAGDKATAKTEQQQSSPPPPKTDLLSRTKMILEQKRKAAAAGFSRAGSAASAGAAGVQRKAKLSKAAGGQSSAASARLDPVKYPNSGLLLKQEFRTFEEGEEDGERAYTPVDPLVRNLTNFGLADGEGGKKHHETLVMRVTVPAHSQSWGVNICPKEHSNFAEILFHFNPRRRFVAMNNREENNWGQQEKYMLPRWPDMFDVSINVAVQIDRAGFHVAVDGKYCATFAHRTKVPPNGEDLALEVMTADDYGTNLGLVVHEIWWGHKDTMPGLPGAAKERQPARPADPWRAGENEDTYIDLHVGNLPSMPNPEQQEAVRKRLSDMFQPYGAIQVRVFSREKNFGFIKFRDHGSAAKALEELSGAEVQGRTLRLSRAAGR